MKRSIRRTCGATLMALALIIACTGCDPVTLSAAGFSTISSAASWATGYVMGSLTTIAQTGTKCYQNGVEVDCSTLPSGS